MAEAGSVENIKLYCFLTPQQLGTLGSKSHLCLPNFCIELCLFSVKKLFLVEYSVSHLNFKNLRWVYELMQDRVSANLSDQIINLLDRNLLKNVTLCSISIRNKSCK